ATELAFDGERIWTLNRDGTLSIATPGTPWTVVTTSALGTGDERGDILYDGANMWVSLRQAGTIVKLDQDGNVVQTIAVGSLPSQLAFDGRNIWAPYLGGMKV